MYVGFRSDPGSARVYRRKRKRVLKAAREQVADATMAIYLGNMYAAAVTTGRYYLPVHDEVNYPDAPVPTVVRAIWPTTGRVAMTYYHLPD